MWALKYYTYMHHSVRVNKRYERTQCRRAKCCVGFVGSIALFEYVSAVKCQSRYAVRLYELRRSEQASVYAVVILSRAQLSWLLCRSSSVSLARSLTLSLAERCVSLGICDARRTHDAGTLCIRDTTGKTQAACVRTYGSTQWA